MTDKNDLIELATADALGTERVASGLSNPLFVTAPPDDFDRLFIVEKETGQIKILNLASGTINETPFIDLDVSTVTEQGLLGLAFDPDYQDNGIFYVNFTDPGGTSTIQRFQVSSDPDVADVSSGEIISRIPQPFSNHNGGWIAFGPDGYLYYGTGDGGSSNDPQDNSQDLTVPLGKMLRIDVRSGTDDFPADPDRNYAIPENNPFIGETVDGEPVREDIWAYGLRNPWRSSFDRETGDLYIGDVGQGAREEINFQPADSTGGENYGWRLREGTIETPSVGGPRPDDNVEPIYDYQRGSDGFLGRSVTGGYVYRGPVTELQGKYIFGDFASSQIWSFEIEGNGIADLTNWTNELRPDQGDIRGISSFGEDAASNLYIVDFFNGEVFRVVGPTENPPPPPPEPALTLSISATSISENGGTTEATVARNSGTSGDLVVNLSGDDTGEATVPATVTIPDGQNSVTFTVTGVNDAIADGDQTVSITASAAGFAGDSDTMTVTDNESPALTVSIDPSAISEAGGAATGTVFRNTDGAGALVVTLSSDDTSEAAVPATVTIGAGQTSATFQVTAVDDAVVDGDQSVAVTASAGGFTADSATVEVTDNDTIGLEVSFVSESAGYQNSVGIYDTETGAAEVLLTNADLKTNPDIATFSKVLDPTSYDLDQIAFFIIPNGNRLNSWSDVELENLQVFEDSDGAYRVRDGDGTILRGTGADAFFAEVDKNPDAFDHVLVQGTEIGFEDLVGGGDQDFNDLVLDVQEVTLIA